MSRNKTAIPISLDAVRVLMAEVIIEGYQPYLELLKKVRRTKPGSARHEELLCEASTAASVLSLKAREAEMAIDEYLESLPDDD